ncbi:MAG: photosynthetic reaction center subunit H [Pseudomonadota bacterium]
MIVEIVGSLDVAQLVLYAFWIFFAGLIWYLQAESRREGYPLEADLTGDYNKDAWLSMPSPKTFVLPHGHGERVYPHPANRDTRPIAAMRASPMPGAPLIPTGDPLKDGVGPASWAERPDYPDAMADGSDKIIPMAKTAHFKVAEQDMSPIGMPVIAADGQQVGEIKELWVDQMESVIRYFEVAVGEETRLIPMHFARFRGSFRGLGKIYYVNNLPASRFPDIPQTASPERITMLEEEKIMGFFGGGTLYGMPDRTEPII